MAAIIEVEGLRKEYVSLRRRRTVAVDDLDLSVPDGGVFGFLGPNGSGKTTTIRCIVGLIRPTKGKVQLFGAPSNASTLPRTLQDVGTLVEAPAMYPRFSGRRNLQMLAGLYGIGNTAVEQALDRVGLADRAKDLVKNYSLGMKQRLGIAATLLKDPQLLILDEPANGLDPAGIKEMRELLRSLGSEGRTVFVSSHILSEIEQTCDQVAILKRGRCIASGPVANILSSARPRSLIVGVSDPLRAADVLHTNGFDVTAEKDRVLVAGEDVNGEQINKLLAESGIWLHELRQEDVNLEDVFLELTGNEGGE